jgi:hypothetical protein
MTKRIFFGSLEHEAIGNNAFFELGDILLGVINDKAKFSYDEGTRKFYFIYKDIRITPGRIIALAGDFFTTPDYTPISFGERDEIKINRFKDACNNLLMPVKMMQCQSKELYL